MVLQLLNRLFSDSTAANLAKSDIKYECGLVLLTPTNSHQPSHKIFQPRTHTFWMSAQKTTLLHDVEEWSSEKTEGEKKRH